MSDLQNRRAFLRAAAAAAAGTVAGQPPGGVAVLGSAGG